MALIDRTRRTGIDRATTWLLLLALVLAVLHHADHVARVDHSGWPFRAKVTPFTYSLLAYPMMLFALFGPARLYWLRWALLLAGTAFVMFAHTAIERPAMQYAMWADNGSLDQGAGLHNMADARLPWIGTLSVAIGMALNVTAVTATVAMLAHGLRMRRR